MWLSLTVDGLRVVDVPEVLPLGGAADSIEIQLLNYNGMDHESPVLVERYLCLAV